MGTHKTAALFGECDSCFEIVKEEELRYYRTYRQTFGLPEEGVWVCQECDFK